MLEIHPPPDELADLSFVYAAARAAADSEETAADVTVAVISVALLARRCGRVADRRRLVARAVARRSPRARAPRSPSCLRLSARRSPWLGWPG